MLERKKIRRLKRRSVQLYENESGIVGVELRFSIANFAIFMLLISSAIGVTYLKGYIDILIDVVEVSHLSTYLDYLPFDSKTVTATLTVAIILPFSAYISFSKAYIYDGVNDRNTVLNIILDKKEKYRDKKREIGKLRKRGDRVVVEEFSDGERVFRIVVYINGRQRKRLARRNEALLANEVMLAMKENCELLGERVAVMLDILKTGDVVRAEEEAHADYLMIALDAVVNFLRENDGATLEDMEKDGEVSRLDSRYFKLALKYLSDAPGGPYVVERDGRYYLSKLLM